MNQEIIDKLDHMKLFGAADLIRKLEADLDSVCKELHELQINHDKLFDAVLLCKKCGEDLGYIFDEHPKVTSHEELTAITKEWVYVQRT